ncbi:MAG: hypothetical protein MSA25_00340 [Clostridiales bacterium]|nr:hypothetical protein [Clostridiales bacterium]
MMAAVLLLIYGGLVFFLVHRLKQIQKNPKKFDTIPGYEEYCKSIWYWPPYREFGKGTPPDNCGVPATGVTFILLSCWYILSSILYIQLMVRARGGEYSFTPTYVSLTCWILSVLFSGFLSDYATMFSKRPVAICCNLHTIFRKDSRSTAWAKMTKIALVSTIFMFPFRLAMLHNYGYVDSEKLVYTPVFSLHEQVFEYDEITQIETIYNEDGSKVKHCYIYNDEGKRFDLAASYSEDGNQFEVITYVAEHLSVELQAELQENSIL